MRMSDEASLQAHYRHYQSAVFWSGHVGRRGERSDRQGPRRYLAGLEVASNNRATGTPEKNKAIIGGSIAHFGTLSVCQRGGKGHHLKDRDRHVPQLGPNRSWPFTMASGGGTASTVWKRAN